MRVKVIIRDGIVSEVLTDGQADVEIIGIDKDYEDYDALCRYEQSLYEDAGLKSIDFTVAHFGEEDNE